MDTYKKAESACPAAGQDKRRDNPQRDSGAAITPEMFLDAIQQERKGGQQKGTLFSLLRRLPPHSQLFLLNVALIQPDKLEEDTFLFKLIGDVCKTTPSHPGKEVILRVKAFSKKKYNLGYYRFFVEVDGIEYGPMKFAHKSAAVLYLMYLVHLLQHPGCPPKILDVSKNKDAFIRYYTKMYRFTNKNPADVFNFLLDGKQGEGQGDLRFLYKSINETLVNTFSYHASSADFEVHRETHLSALPEWIEIPAELVDLAAII